MDEDVAQRRARQVVKPSNYQPVVVDGRVQWQDVVFLSPDTKLRVPWAHKRLPSVVRGISITPLPDGLPDGDWSDIDWPDEGYRVTVGEHLMVTVHRSKRLGGDVSREVRCDDTVEVVQ